MLGDALRAVLPRPVKRILAPIRNRFVRKNEAELAFWRSRLDIDGGTFRNDSYERLLLGMAEEPDDGFLAGKVVADFGCGPRGSLVWARSAALRIGIDVLADRYADAFASNITAHGMIYLKSTEKVIPLPSALVDVMFTLNAMDHVDDFPGMCSEILRVLKPGGTFVGSFNLEEPASACEPQRLDEGIVRTHLLDALAVRSLRLSRKGPGSDPYAPFFDGTMAYERGEEGVLWVRAEKPA